MAARAKSEAEREQRLLELCCIIAQHLAGIGKLDES
jgi:hypothetical protein